MCGESFQPTASAFHSKQLTSPIQLFSVSLAVASTQCRAESWGGIAKRLSQVSLILLLSQISNSKRVCNESALFLFVKIFVEAQAI